MKKNILLFLLLTLYFPFCSTAQCWRMIATGNANGLGIKQDGSLWMWGSSALGLLPHNNVYGVVDSPVRVGDAFYWQTASITYSHVLAIRTDSTLWSWGFNVTGQLGSGIFSGYDSVAKKVGNAKWITVAAGQHSSLGIRQNGSLWGWGRNNQGQLGDALTADSPTPRQIGEDYNWRKVSTYNFSSAGIKSDGSLWTWGSNAGGQIGDGTTISRWQPTRIGVDTNWKDVCMGMGVCLALKTDGTLWCWGSNTDGSLGDGTTISRNTPGLLNTDTDWVQISASDFCAARKSDNTLWTWGRNTLGGIGNGNYGANEMVTSPYKVGGATWKDISLGSQWTAAVNDTGTIMTWGGNVGKYDHNSPAFILQPSALPSSSCDSAVNPTNIVEHEKASLRIFPNPAADKLDISFSLSAPCTYQVDIVNVTGQVELRQVCDIRSTGGQHLKFDVRGLSKGLHFVTIITDKGRYTARFVSL